MIDVKLDRCCGCAACAYVCQHQAIQMQANSLGFLYAKVDTSLCVDCGLCNVVCPFENTLNNDDDKNISAYAVRHCDLDEIKKSRSGAVFVALSDVVLSRSGIVYGAGYTSHFQVVHKRATNQTERDELRGSKYSQSQLLGIFSQIKEDLKNNLTVLFSGTPCQVFALKKTISKHLRKNLICIDIVCHGVASPRIWDDYLNYLEKIENKKIISVDFRDKIKFGWSGLHRESFVFTDNVKRTYPYTYYQSFLLRECCSYCPFANINRPSDITIGDFWGWQKAVPNFAKDDLGVSLVICNTVKGMHLFESSLFKLVSEKVPVKDCIQPNLASPTPEDVFRDTFEKDYNSHGFNYVRGKYWKVSIKEWLKFYIKRMLFN